MIERLTDEFYDSFKELCMHYRCIIVHGGGPIITSMLERVGIEGEFHQGLRKTTKETLEIVEMVLGGKVNAQIVSRLADHNIRSLGIKGCDGGLLKTSFIDQENLGFVGTVEEVGADIIDKCLEADYLPVIAPLGKTGDGQTVNINADLAAAAIAKAVHAEKLIFVTDVPGVLREDEIMKETDPDELSSLIENGLIYGGMIPKVQSAVQALSDHLQEVMIVSGEQALFQSKQLTGTKIRSKRKEGVE